MPKGPALIDLKPRLSSFEERRNITSARDRYDSLAANIFDEKDRDQEIFKRKCFSYIKEGNLENLNEVIESWKKKGKIFCLNFKDDATGNTPIILAAQNNSKNISNWLLQQGVDITLRNNENKTALELASSDLRCMLISETTQNDLKHASWQGNAAAVKKILEKSTADINCRNEEGMTPLLLATRDINFFKKLKIMKNYHPLKVIRMLLKYQADATIGDDKGKTAFHHLLGNIGLTAKEILKILLMKNVLKIDHLDNSGSTPLHTACKLGDVNIVQILLSQGADISAQNEQGKTPLHYAVTFGHVQLSELLIKHGADPTMADISGDTPIDYATKMKSKVILRIFEGTKNHETASKKLKEHHTKKTGKVFIDGFDVIKADNKKCISTKTFSENRILSPILKSVEDVALKYSEKTTDLDDVVKLPVLQQPQSDPPKSPSKSRNKQKTPFPKSFKTPSIGSKGWFDEREKIQLSTDVEGIRSEPRKEDFHFPRQLSNPADQCSDNQGRQSPRKLPSLNDGRQLHNLFTPCSTRLPFGPQIGAASAFPNPLSLVLEEGELSQLVSKNLSAETTDIETGIAYQAIHNGIYNENEESHQLSLLKSIDEHSTISPIPNGLEKLKYTGNDRLNEQFNGRYANESDRDYTGEKNEKKNQKAMKAKKKSSLKILKEMEIAHANVKDLVVDYSRAENICDGSMDEEEVKNDCKSKIDTNEDAKLIKDISNVISDDKDCKVIEKKHRLKHLRQMKCDTELLCGDTEDCQFDEQAVDVEESKLLKQKVNKQNEEFLKEIKEGKVRDGMISTLVKRSDTTISCEQKLSSNQQKSAKKEQKKAKINSEVKIRKTVATNCVKIEAPPVKRSSCKNVQFVKNNDEKSCRGRPRLKSVKNNGLKKTRKRKQLCHLSVLPGFENCLNDDSFENMIYGKSMDKHPRSSMCSEDKIIKSTCVTSTDDSGNTCSEDDALIEHDKAALSDTPSRVSSDVEVNEKYKSIFDFYSSDEDQNDVEHLPSDNHEYQNVDEDKVLNVDGNQATHCQRECLDQTALPGLNKLEHLTVGKPDAEIEIQRRKSSNLTGFLPMLSNQDDTFQRMTEIAFARGVGNSASSYRGSGYYPSKESIGNIPLSQFPRTFIYESIKRSSISTQTSSDDSECGDDDLRDWVKGNVLGQGAYGTVYCALTSRGRMVAVKQVELNRTHAKEAEKQYRKLQEEIHMLKCLNHRCIVKFIGTSMEDNVVNIFMEHIPGGSLALVLKRFGPLTERVFQRYTRQIISGVAYLHQNGIVHRDIKGANIMLSTDGVVKLIDFGCAKRLNLSLSQSSQSINSCKGTPFWMAPEVIRGIGNNYKSDVWSVGCTVYEMATGKPPWHGSPCAAMYAIADYSTEIPVLPENFSEESRDFVKLCLIRLPEDRPSSEQLQRHSFIAKGSSYSKYK